MRKLLLPALLGVALIYSCQRTEIDFDQINDLSLKPGLEVPLINAHLDLQDLAEKDSNLVVNPDQSLSVYYRNDSLYQISSLELVKIPTQDAQSFPLSTAVNPASFQLDMGTIQGVELYSTTFSAGKLKVDLRSPGYNRAAQVELEVSNATNGQGDTLLISLNLPAGDTVVSQLIDLGGTTFDFTNGTPGGFNDIGLRLQIMNGADFSPSESFELVVELQELVLQNTTGFFGERKVALPAGNFDFDMSGVKDFVNGFTLSNPQLALTAKSEVGIPIEISTDIKGVNAENAIVDLDEEPALIQGAPDPQTPVNSRLEFNKQNSNIVDFLAFLPNKILYGGMVQLNPAGRGVNFIDASSKVTVGVEVDVPLEVSIDNMSLSETIAFNTIAENPDAIEELTLIFRSANGFPLDLNLQLELLDSVTEEVIDDFSLQLLTAAPVDGSGRAVTRSHREERLKVTPALLESFRRSRKMRLTATVNTDPQVDFVKFYSDYALDIRVAAIAKLKLNLD